MAKEIITDVDTIAKLIETKSGNKLHRILIYVLIANIGTVIGGLCYAMKNFYIFQTTVAEVQTIKVVQESHSIAIQDLRIADADHNARIKAIEKNK